MSAHHVLLIPGFFGFENFGDFRYFDYVREVLEESFAVRGHTLRVTEVVTSPTSSIRHRAARVIEALARVCAEADGPIHLVGHSTGGLDARLAITPTASLPTDTKFDAYHRVESLVTVATPHYGAPSAAVLGSFMGKPLLRVLGFATANGLRYGKLPLSVFLKMGKLIARADDVVGLRNNILDLLVDQLFGDFSLERREAIARFMQEVAADQSLLFQLTPEGIDLFNATTADPSDLRYGSVVTYARPPGVRGATSCGTDVYGYGMYGLFTFLYALARRMPAERIPKFTEPQELALRKYAPRILKRTDNDGMVPSLSQVWGDVIHVVEADHFDVVGHFSDRRPSGKHIDWLSSGCRFDRGRFEALWEDVAGYLMTRP